MTRRPTDTGTPSPASCRQASRPVPSAPGARGEGPRTREGTAVVGGGPVWARALLFVVPAVWLGLLIGISLIEAPLKFTAPGITIPLGLGIGRRVFFAMNMVEIVLAALLLLALVRTCGRPGLGSSPAAGRLWGGGLAAAGLLAVKTAAIRPFLNRRTDMVLAGIDGGGSSWHFAYIAVDGLLILTVVGLIVLAARALLAPTSEGGARPVPPSEGRA